jgi:hypothetical protein
LPAAGHLEEPSVAPLAAQAPAVAEASGAVATAVIAPDGPPAPQPEARAAARPAPAPPAGDPTPRGHERDGEHRDGGMRPACTAAQLRRFIKSRPWVPMHELRRRFGINGVEDDVTPVRVGELTLYIGLPPAEGRLMGELLSAGDVGYELSLDPGAPVVVGVYPMRPVPRG